MAKKFSITDYVQGEEDVSKMDTMEITPIPIRLIDANSRNFYGVDTIEEDLAESIEVSGLLTPLGVVRKEGGRYKLISGHRRLRALTYLYNSRPGGREKYAAIPCVIYDSPEDADREELMLIHANAQRTKTGPEIALEAKKTTEILTRMKGRGVELPGRMRDRVAEALKISSTRLARLEAIEKNLTYSGWEQKWKAQKINEAVAYRLSQLDYQQQMHAADWMNDHDIKDADISVKLIEDALAHPPLTNPGCKDPLAYKPRETQIRELVARMDPWKRLSGVDAPSRAELIAQLKISFRNTGQGGPDWHWTGKGPGIEFEDPVQIFFTWAEMADAMIGQALRERVSKVDHQTEARADEGVGPYEATVADPMKAPTVAVANARWRSCRDDPPKGWTLAFKFYPWNADTHDFDLDLVQFHGGKWYGVYGESDDEFEITMYDRWIPASPLPAEAWE